MAEIFISYKSERRAAAEHFAEVLRRHGYTVWFDYELVKGADFAAQIERQIRGAKALVALWCSLSVSSRWVREEVHLAHDLGILVPVKIEPCEIPFGFRLADTIDLTGWDGAPRSPVLDPLIDALEGRIGRDAVPDRKGLIEYEGAWRRFGGHPLKDFALNTELRHAETRRFGPEGENGPQAQQHAAEAGGAPENGLLQWSKEEWERLKTSADIGQIRRFAKHAHPYYAAEAERLAREQEQAEAQERRRERELAKAAGGDAAAMPWKPAAVVGAAAALALAIYLWPSQAERRLPPVPSLRTATAPAQPAATQPKPLAEASPPSGERAAKPLSQAEIRRFAQNPGQSFGECEHCPKMVMVPAGKFDMGPEEGPQHEVRIPKPFAVGKFTVKFDEWAACKDDGGCKSNPSPNDEGWGTGKRPVINVSWNDAQEYISWLNGKVDGEPYRLLSEAEWEYAARAGTKTAYSFGDSITKKQAQFSEGTWGSAGKTVEVGSFPANIFGLHDMHGNVWQWTQDCWNENYNAKPESLKTNGGAWTTGDCSRRVLRGGSWGGFSRNLRSAIRYWDSPDVRNILIGFRLARTLNY